MLPLDIWCRIFSFMSTNECVHIFNMLWSQRVFQQECDDMNYLDTFFAVVSECRDNSRDNNQTEGINTYKDSYNSLIEMGFSEMHVENALHSTGGNISNAVELLIF